MLLTYMSKLNLGEEQSCSFSIIMLMYYDILPKEPAGRTP